MKSIIQNGRYCYETGNTNCPLHKHHIFNGPLRDWSEANGLWVYLAYDVHENLHDGDELKLTLKRIGQYYFELNHSRLEFMLKTHKNYLTTPLSKEEKEKYRIIQEDDVLDLNEFMEIDKLFQKSNRVKSWKV